MNRLVEPGSAFHFTVQKEDSGKRIDLFLSQQFPLYSRSFLQNCIAKGAVTLNQQLVHKGGSQVKEGDQVHITFPSAPDKQEFDALIEGISIPIIYTHDHFLIINKPAGLTVHRSHTNSQEPTLIDWLTKHFQDIRHVGSIDRPGIVHRLDKDTSGLMIIARTNYGHTVFSQLFKQRNIKKTYWALVHGAPAIKEGTINLSIARHPVERHKMTTTAAFAHKARQATTSYTVLRSSAQASFVHAYPITGRTHQIRVHFAALGHPLLGDAIYGKKSSVIARHALHAYSLQFTFDHKEYTFYAPIPDDFHNALKQLVLTA
jgi:23S rRNA pseudouridine1911/1915/1917 synthase